MRNFNKSNSLSLPTFKGGFFKYVNYIFYALIIFFVYKIFNFSQGKNLNNPFSFDSVKDNTNVAGNSKDQKNTKRGIETLLTEVIDALNSAWNYVGSYDYPTINRLANLNKTDFTYLVQVYNNKYRAIYGMSLYKMIDSEMNNYKILGVSVWGEDVGYDSVLNKMKLYKLTN